MLLAVTAENQQKLDGSHCLQASMLKAQEEAAEFCAQLRAVQEAFRQSEKELEAATAEKEGLEAQLASQWHQMQTQLTKVVGKSHFDRVKS